MNNNIFFDLCSYNLDVFKSKLKDIKFAQAPSKTKYSQCLNEVVYN